MMKFSARQMQWLIAVVFLLCMVYTWWLAPLNLLLRVVTTICGALIAVTSIMAAGGK